MGLLLFSFVPESDATRAALGEFYIGVTDISPALLNPTLHPPNYEVCTYSSDYISTSGRQKVACTIPVSGRYLLIQQAMPFVLCEVEVYTGES